MTWQERLREGAYTSPSGVRTVYQFENVRKFFEKKTSAFEFVDANGTLIQDNGHTGLRIPLRIFFSGDDYDLQADAFEELLKEVGTGKLEHPVYGTRDVVPFGTVSRKDELATAANQAIIELTFWQTIKAVFPVAQTDPGTEVISAVSEYNAATATEFAQVTDLKGAVSQATFENSYLAVFNNTVNNLQTIADTQDDVRNQFNTISASISLGLDTLIETPETLAAQTTLLVQSPARALTTIGSRLTAYVDLANALITGDKAIVSNPSQSNEFHLKDLYASTYLTGSILSVVNHQFFAKTQALEAAEDILTQLDDLIAWRDANFAALEEIDTGGAYQQLQEAAALTAGFLVEISFSLKQERSLTLTRDRTVIDLLAELYGEVDEQFDFFVSSNNLSGAEILELPKGRIIVYYV